MKEARARLRRTMAGPRRWTAAAAALTLLSYPALAEVGPPVPLTPGLEEGGSPDEANPGEIEIEIDTLTLVEPDYAGPLEAAEGGFGIEMWRGTDRALVERLLPRLPLVPESPALRDLARRLLLSNAAAPPGPSGGLNLMVVRAERLAALGRPADAAALLRLVPSAQMTGEAARRLAESLLLLGETDAACAEVEAGIARFTEDVFWQKALIVCQAENGRRSEALLGLDLLREQAEEDEAFLALAEELAGLGGREVASLPQPTPLHIALFRALARPLPADALAVGDPAVLAAAATLATDPVERLLAAERAARAGALDPAGLAQLYEADGALPGALAAAALGEGAAIGPRERAALYRAAAAAASAEERAALLQRILQAARGADYPAAVAVHLPLLQQLAPTPPVAWFAAEAGRALYMAGRYEQAGAWLSLAQISDHPAAAEAVPALWLLARIAGRAAPLAWDARAVESWQRSAAAKAGGGAARLFAVLEAFGENPAEAWRMLADGRAEPAGRSPDPALWFALGSAAEAGRLGETVLLSLMSLGEGGVAAADPILLARVLESLRRVGLEAEARTLAFEALLPDGG